MIFFTFAILSRCYEFKVENLIFMFKFFLITNLVKNRDSSFRFAAFTLSAIEGCRMTKTTFLEWAHL